MTIVSAQPTNWASRGIGGGGALFSPSINPANPGEMYISCDMSQLFHTTDRGNHWNEIHFIKIQGGHDSYVSFTKDKNILYTVDYESVNGNDHIRPMKSTDGGKNWSVLSGNPYSLSPSGGVLRVLVDYNNPNNVVIADYGTIYFSPDGGSTFTKIHTNINVSSGNHIAGAFFDGNNIYIGTNDGIIFSTNGGTAFNTMSVSGMGASEYILSFAGAKKGSTTRFLCLTASNVWSGYQYGSNYLNAWKGVYTMDNASGTWVSKIGSISKGSDFPVFVGMAMNCIDTLYLCGGSNSRAPIVMRSIGTGNWIHTFMSTGNTNVATGWSGAGADHTWSFPEAPFGFEVDKLDAGRLMFTDYSCVHVSKDYGFNWQQKYLDSSDQNVAGSTSSVGKKYHGIGLENTTNWQVMWTDSTRMFSAFSDINGIMSDDKGKSWKFIPNLTQNSVYRILKHTDGKIYAATSNVHDMYQSTRIYDVQIDNGIGNLMTSSDNGASFQLIHAFQHPVVWIATDPNNVDRMYASVLSSSKATIGGIWVTNNLSAGALSTWTKLSTPPRSNGHPYNITVLKNSDLVVSYSARKPTTGNQFTDSSGVYYYNYATSQWADRSHANMKWYTKDVVVDPNDTSGKTWYAAVFSGWGSAVPAGTGGVYKTTDKGLTWKQISNAYRADGVTIVPGKPDQVYFTTETDGLYYSSNATNASPSFTRVNSYPFRHPMRVFINPWKPTEVWVSSFGSGMMVSAPGYPLKTNIPNEHSFGIELYPNPAKNELRVMNPENLTHTGYTVFNVSGTVVQQGILNAELNILDIGKLPAGMYFFNTQKGAVLFVKE
jgi:photosystem II stability/assembly factor-like uncharacterized protein